MSSSHAPPNTSSPASLPAVIREIFHTTTFRLAMALGGSFLLAILCLFSFIYVQTSILETERVDRTLAHDARELVADRMEDTLRAVDLNVVNDLHRVTLVGVFEADGTRIVGNLLHLPTYLPVDGVAHGIKLLRLAGEHSVREKMRAVALRIHDGRILILARNIEQLDELRHVVLGALLMGVVPAVILALIVAVWISAKTLDRVRDFHTSIARIMNGDLSERLSLRGGDGDFDRLSTSINGMLDRIEDLIRDLKSAGDNIAHDLRTPLTRVRMRLEQARSAQDLDSAHAAIDLALNGTDRTLSIITALLRIAEIETGQRRSHFSAVNLPDLLSDLEALYGSIAEDAGLTLGITTPPPPVPAIYADADLLMEALANLVGNAIKFTPAPGDIMVEAYLAHDGAMLISVSDTGPGISAFERKLVTQRFYRSDRSRHVEGTGLGLSLVAAVASLHGFSFTLADLNDMAHHRRKHGMPVGCIATLRCPRESVLYHASSNREEEPRGNPSAFPRSQETLPIQPPTTPP
ncbi:sensor histidine kinase [Granulibacter bethesdensis]|uniref:sensor histidine kinase n=1 Tax=Granulibacter bethesdensis TaxID=364410 RepID=UPI0003F1D0BC|nr:HAMP domain-containing sensor histidine kinase [Granulibacter bethesdensis]AHJ68505.1 Two component system histidine kinase [Granulibacter bethesdensis]